MFGNILTTLGFLSALVASLMYFFYFRGAKNTLGIARISFHLMATSTILASVFLLYLIVTHQFQYKYIYSYSDTSLPLGLLMSTFYAGQEGSFILWALFTAVIGIFLQQYTSKRDDLEPRVMSIFCLVQTFLLLMITPMVKNPFALIWSEAIFADARTIGSQFFNLPFLQNYFFSDNSTGQQFVKIDASLIGLLQANGIAIKDFIINGKGLNPLLQNFWMQIHPPILFVGFAALSVPFSFAFAALMKNEYVTWVKQSFPWLLFGSMILGLGIMLGGYWAYGVLGWGGYWAWDPVENSSLIPWIISVALIHTMLVQKKSSGSGGIGGFAKTNLVLSILAFVLVLYSTFLTRSGVLGDASVHSFVDPGYFAYLLLMVFMGTFILLGGGLLIYRWNYLKEQTKPHENLLSREMALFTGTVILGATAAVTFVGTSAPIIGRSVQISFYDEMILPLAILIGLLNGFSLILKWKETKGQDIFKKSLFSIIATVITTIVLVIFGLHDFMMIIFAFSSAFAFFVNAEIAYKVFKGNFQKAGAYISHMGIALLFLGVIASAKYDTSVDVDLIKNQPTEALGYKMTFTGYQPTEDGKFSFNIDLEKDGKKYQVNPVMFYSDFNQGLMRNPDILQKWTRDFYVSPISYEDGSQSDQGNSKTFEISRGESIKFGEAEILFVDYDFDESARSNMMTGGEISIGAKLEVKHYGKVYKVTPKFITKEAEREDIPVDIKDADLTIRFASLSADQGKATIIVSPYTVEKFPTPIKQEILAVNASIKPFINLVWGGTIILTIGFIIAIVRRSRESKN